GCLTHPHIAAPVARRSAPRAPRHQSEGHCFQRVASLFSPCYLFLKKLPKSLILHGNCPSLRDSLPVFLENVTGRYFARKNMAEHPLLRCAGTTVSYIVGSALFSQKV
ncbi:MAG: hypothetical protein ABSA90_08220, partial [Xanthobacteraceae bacterium]